MPTAPPRPRAELGGRVVAEPFDDAMFRRAVLAAPDGATFAVSQPQYPI